MPVRQLTVIVNGATGRMGYRQHLLRSLLAIRDQGGVEVFLVPIDACYELAGRMRMLWRGFDGGAEARQSIAAFLDRVRARSGALGEET